jgi:hypothetical protein
MKEAPLGVPNLAGVRIAAFYEALEAFERQLRYWSLGHWADCLRGERRNASYAGGALLRTRQVLEEIVRRYPRSTTGREARRLLDECDALWRGVWANEAPQQNLPLARKRHASRS